MSDLKAVETDVFPIVVSDYSPLRSVNFFLLKQHDSLILIDAGLNNGDCWEALENTLRNNGFTLQDICKIILTHHHIDHVGLVNRIVSKNPIPVYAHSASIPRLKRDHAFLTMRAKFFKNLYREMGCAEVGDKYAAYLEKAIIKNKNNVLTCDIFEISGNELSNFEIINVPGHSPDQIALYDADRKWLFSGDLLIKHISSNALVEPDQSGNRLMTLKEHIHSLEKISRLDLELVFSGHGSLIESPQQLIRKRLNGIQKKAGKFAALIQNGLSSASEIAQAYYGEKYIQEFSLVMSEVIGHLDYLEVSGQVKKEMMNGVWRYSVTGRSCLEPV
ncbi:MBL fold metallo-hydrolase [Bacillus sp. V3-13]|uniref:MBL fold metallo-hydrolase n=1 Tax=Bacillus sp. V3-13 TaxID=2053728 RepID=UPI000C78E145|nr:MBL fold metallo-hydrolase [Bacillus sp. V3-13]PLR78739.1 MBL fold metallo-hydrolase [Bacillus sp. V3-13]